MKVNLFFCPVPYLFAVAYPGIFSGGGSTNSVEDKGQRTGIWERYSGVLEAAVIWYKKFHFI
jgi:hypothetical protein